MTIEEICNKYIKVKATGILALHQHPKQDWAFKVVSGKESDGCNGCFWEKYYPLRLPYICAAQEREDRKNVQFKRISKTMTREEAKELLPIIQAYAEGKTIECKCKNPFGSWTEAKCPSWSVKLEYRIRPEPKYRPFKNQEECWNEMLKHQPFGWVTDKCKYVHIVCVRQSNIEYSPDEDDNILYSCIMTFSDVLEQGYTFADGTPFGIKREE